MNNKSRFRDWEYPQIEEGVPTKYNWVVQHTDKFTLGYKTDIGAFDLRFEGWKALAEIYPKTINSLRVRR